MLRRHTYTIVGKGEAEMMGGQLFADDKEEGCPLGVGKRVVEEIAEKRASMAT